MRVPWSTPAGTRTWSDLRLSTRPSPLHDGQGSAMTPPTPRQPGQVRPTTQKPWTARTWPRPPHLFPVPAARTGFAFAGQADAGALVDAGRNADLERLAPLDAPLAPT